MKTTLVLDDALYRAVKVTAAARGVTVGSVVEEALRLLLLTGPSPNDARPGELPAWSMGEPTVDIADNRALRDALDRDRGTDALR